MGVHSAQGTEIMMWTVATVLKFFKEPGGIIDATIQISMDNISQGPMPLMLMELIGTPGMNIITHSNLLK